jgi:hypothetical protein
MDLPADGIEENPRSYYPGISRAREFHDQNINRGRFAYSLRKLSTRTEVETKREHFPPPIKDHEA